jgi:flagellin-like protein
MKGISTIIATILMLMITIALAGTAYMYINGVFSSRTAVVLSIDSSTICNATNIIAAVKNDGTSISGVITVTATSPSGVVAAPCQMNQIPPGTVNSTCYIAKAGAGTWSLIASGSGATSQKATVFCFS